MLSPNRLPQVLTRVTLRRIFFGLFLAGILFCALFYVASGEDVSEATFQGWRIEDRGGFCSESDGVFRLRSSGGDICPSIFLYKQIAPVETFNFSLQVNSATLESFGIYVGSRAAVFGSTDCVNFEFGHYGEGMFLVARRTTMDNWIWDNFTDGVADVWYTMQLTVCADPFKVVAEVFDGNGTLMGSFSASDMINLSFEDIKYLGFGVWGYSPTDYSVKNITCSLDSQPYDNTSYLSISTDLSSIFAGSAVNVVGTLSSTNGTPIQHELVVLSYTFAGIDSWIPITSGLTNETGEYTMQWINSASGTFTLKAEWKGNATFMETSNTTTVSFVPYQNQQVFFVESNSTVSALAFNSTNSELSFNVIGPSGTSGYVKATIAKSMLQNCDGSKVYIDGKQLNCSVTSTADSWIVTFNYSHSSHQISMYLADASSQLLGVDWVFWASFVTLAFASAAVGLVMWKRRKSANIGYG